MFSAVAIGLLGACALHRPLPPRPAPPRAPHRLIVASLAEPPPPEPPLPARGPLSPLLLFVDAGVLLAYALSVSTITLLSKGVALSAARTSFAPDLMDLPLDFADVAIEYSGALSLALAVRGRPGSNRRPSA